MQAGAVLDVLGHPDVVGYQTTTEGEMAWLFPDEQTDIAGASSRRIAEFAAGRACAHAGLEALGVRVVAIGKGADRSPQWPADIEGSIAHTDGKAMAVVARRSDLGSAGIGIDVEQRGRVRSELYRKLFTDGEIDVILSAADEGLEATVRFSAKEAFYKAQYPLTQSWVSFTDVAIESSDGAYRAVPATSLPVLDDVEWPIEVGVSADDAFVTTGVRVQRASGQG